MELSKEGNLYSKMKLERIFSESKASRLMASVLKAIRFMHSQSPPILHRDLKPENLLLFGNEKVKLTDFGWSAQNDEIRNTFCGTQEYLAPEMIRGTGHDEKLDIWTLGVLLYEMVHGRTPFYVAKSRGDIRNQRKMIERKILSGKFNLSEKLEERSKKVIRAMLHPDPKSRPSASELLSNFKFFMRDINKHSRSISTNIILKENNLNIKDLQKLRVEVATLSQKNNDLNIENESLKSRLRGSKSSSVYMELELSKKKKEGLDLEVKLLNQQLSEVREDLEGRERQHVKLEHNLTIARDSISKIETDLSRVKDLNVYLFKQTKVRLVDSVCLDSIQDYPYKYFSKVVKIVSK